LSRPGFFVFGAREAGVFLAEGAAPRGGVDLEGLCLGLETDLTMVEGVEDRDEAVEATAEVKKVTVWRWRPEEANSWRNMEIWASSRSLGCVESALEVEVPIGERSIEEWLVMWSPWLEC
jgi:hypothetical protein